MNDATQQAVNAMNGLLATHLKVADQLRSQVEAERTLKNKYKLDADELAQKLLALEARKIHDNERMEWMAAQIGQLKLELRLARSVSEPLTPTPPITPPPESDEELDVNKMLDQMIAESNKREREGEPEHDHPTYVIHHKRAHHKTLVAEPKTPREALSKAVAETLEHNHRPIKTGGKMARMSTSGQAPPKVNRTVPKFELLK